MVLTLKAPAMVAVEPSSLMIESPMPVPEVNLAKVPLVPPPVETLPPLAQLPAVVQTLYVPAVAGWNRYVTLAVGAAKPNVVVLPLAVALKVEAVEPWRVSC
jgi:hypothetical protein